MWPEQVVLAVGGDENEEGTAGLLQESRPAWQRRREEACPKDDEAANQRALVMVGHWSEGRQKDQVSGMADNDSAIADMEQHF